ncbi:MAG: DNA polymerase I [Pseudomonadota bacterium]
MAHAKKRFVLIDGANYIFRAYYAIRPLTTSKGFPTNALYGFTRMLLKIFRDLKPDYWVVVFDTKEPTFRDEEYADYKANRKEPPSDLVQQFPHFERLIDAFSIPTLKKPGFEADDVIATLVKKEAKVDIEVVILSGDKDLMQLVTDDVKMLDEMRDKWIGPKEVVEKLGVEPSQVVDLLSLSGDSSDNIPGVSGIGRKTAVKLLTEYKTLDNILKHSGEMKGSLSKKIAEGTEFAHLSKRLASLHYEVPLEYVMDDLKAIPFDPDKVRPILKEFEFTKLLAELAPHSNIDFSSYRMITDLKSLRDFIDLIKEKKILSLDLETTSLDVMKADIVGISLAVEPMVAAYIPVGHSTGEQLSLSDVLSELSSVLKDSKIKKIGQNLNYDLSILKRIGVEISGVYFDTMLASYLINPSSEHNLDAMAELYLDHHTIKYSDMVGKGKKEINFADVDMMKAKDYSCEDADVALRLYEKFSSQIEGTVLEKLNREMEVPLLAVLIDMQLSGMKVDKSKLQSLGSEFERRLEVLSKSIFEIVGSEFNINSPAQLGEVLFSKLGLPGGKRTKTGYSTDQSVLEKLAIDHDVANLLLEYRTLGKLRNTYVDSLLKLINQKTGRIHTSFNQTGTATGRLSSSKPNLQNIPVRGEEGKKIRSCFISEEGFKLISADYSQIELRILAHISENDLLVQAFLDGLDVHSITAAGIFGIRVGQVTDDQRSVGKTINFSVLYGQTPFGLSKQLKIPPDEAKDYIDSYFKKYKDVKKLKDKVIKEAKERQYVETMFGRRRYIPDINSQNQNLVQAAERVAFNTLFQGSAADIMKMAMIDVHKGLPKISPKSHMIMQVHDELVIESPERDVERVSDFVKERMENIVKLKVPLIVDVGAADNWAKAH